MIRNSASDPGDTSYQDQLGETLRLRDVTALRSFLIQHASTFGDDRQVQAINAQSAEELGELRHRMILARADLADLHAASRDALGMHPAPKTRRPGSQRRRR